MRSDPAIFNFVKWLRVGEEACPTLEQAKARLKELYPSKPGWPDTTLVISHSKRMAVNAAANRALAPEASKLLQLEVIHIDLGETQNAKNSPQSMRVWPGLRLMGAGGKIPKGVFVAVAEVELDGVRRNSVQEADAAVDQHAPPGRAAGGAADGGAVREGQPITRAALQRSCCAVRGDCARGHGGACGAVEHSGLGFLQGAWKMHIFLCFCMFFGRCQPKMVKRGTGPFFSFFGRIQKRCHSAPKMVKRDTGPLFSFFGRIQKRCH